MILTALELGVIEKLLPLGGQLNHFLLLFVFSNRVPHIEGVLHDLVQHIGKDRVEDVEEVGAVNLASLAVSIWKVRFKLGIILVMKVQLANVQLFIERDRYLFDLSDLEEAFLILEDGLEEVLVQVRVRRQIHLDWLQVKQI